MIRKWLRRHLGVERLEVQCASLQRHVLFLDQWVRNLDAAVYRIDSRTYEPKPADLKALATQIRQQVMASKAKFPTQTEEIK